VKPIIIGISGYSASGKTYLVEKLRAIYGERQLAILQMDHYYKPTKYLQKDFKGVFNFDVLNAINIEQYHEHLLKLKQGKIIYLSEYTFNNPAIISETIVIHPAPVIILEGLMLFQFEQLVDEFDYKIWVNAEKKLRFQRRLTRDVEQRKLPKLEITHQWKHHVKQQENQLNQDFLSKIDLIIDNQVDMDIYSIKILLESHGTFPLF
jgi:uridine kinase